MARKRKSKKNKKTRSGLADLPIEMIEQISFFIVYPDGAYYLPWTFELFPLRLTCRALRSKSEHCFAKMAFGRYFIDLSYHDLHKLMEISQHAVFRLAVKHLAFICREAEAQEYTEVCSRLEEDQTPGQRNMDITTLRAIHDKMADCSYMERSGTDAAMLTLALRNLPNLQIIDIMLSANGQTGVRDTAKYGAASGSHLASVVLSAVALSEVKLYELNTTWNFWGKAIGVAIQELGMPSLHLSRFCNLRKLELLLSTGDATFRGKKDTS